MRVREIVCSKSARVNVGNYEGVEHFVSMKADLDELDDPTEVAAELCATAERAIVRQLHRSYRVRGKTMSSTEVAKHHGFSHAPSEELK